MSGLSLAVAPRTDPNAGVDDPSAAPMGKKETTSIGGMMGSLRMIELQLVAFILVFSASGLVPLLDLVFPVFVSLYLLFLSRLAFPKTTTTTSNSSSHQNQASNIFSGGALFRAYVVVGTTVGLFLPLAYVLGGFARGDDHAVRSATPHLFLLSVQILTENLVSGLGLFSAPVRALVPMIYTVRREFVIVDWIYDVWINKRLPANAPVKDVAWLWFGKVLALANLAYFSINLFGFLIPKFLPKAFERYFQERDEVHFKMAEDKRASNPAKVAEATKSEETKKSD